MLSDSKFVRITDKQYQIRLFLKDNVINGLQLMKFKISLKL